MEDALSNPITCYPRSPGEDCLPAQYPYVPKITMMIIEQHPLDTLLPNASVHLRTHNKEDWAGIWQASCWNLAFAEALLDTSVLSSLFAVTAPRGDFQVQPLDL